MDNEEPFAAEAQEEGLLWRMRTPDRDDIHNPFDGQVTQEAEGFDETSPLVARPEASLHQTRSHVSDSRDTGIEESHNGGPHPTDLPWYKKPSVS